MANPLLARALGRSVSTFLLLYFCTAWYVCCYEIGYGHLWTIQGRRGFAAFYVTLTTLIISVILRTFIYLLFLPAAHCSPPPPSTLPPSVISRSVPLLCSSLQPLGPVSPDEEIELERCFKDSCAGRWKGGRTRHCSVCKTCRVGWDHHCPWFNNCLTLPHIKAFLLLTSLTPPGILFIALPPFSLIMRDLHLVLRWSYSDEEMGRVWWGRWYSWLVGPFGRWGVGLVWSYRRFGLGFGNDVGSGEGGGEGGRKPSLFYLALLTCGVVFACVTLALSITTTVVLSKGELSVDRARRKAYRKQLSLYPDLDRVDAMTREKVEMMRPQVRLFIPDLQIRSRTVDGGGRYGGTVVLVPVTWRPETETSLLREVWRSAFFPSYYECTDRDEERVRRTLRLQGYL